MYAVVNHLHLNIPVDQLRPGIVEEAIPLLASMPGFLDFYFVKVADDRATILLFWDSAANAENGAKTFGPTWFARNIAPYLAGPQERSVGEVLARR
jgi:heme-degrading monooxygenase HmoA